jgi:hypothetical protein
VDRPTRTLLAIVALWGVVQFLPFSTDRLISKSFDDACYFARIAENVAWGHGFTFDQINPTNGYQPLWLYLLIPIQRLPLSLESRFFAGLMLQCVLLTVAAFLLYGTLARLTRRSLLLASAAVFSTLVFLPAINGMETAVQILLIVSLFAFGYRAKVFERPGVLRSLAFGVLAGMMILARLDSIFLAIALGAVLLIRALGGGTGRRSRFAQLGLIALGAALVVSPYLAHNFIRFGAFVPISGQIKSSFPHAQWHASLLERFGVRGLIHIGLATAFSVWYLLRLIHLRGAPFERRFLLAAALVGSVALLLHAAHALLFMKWAVFRWHFIWYALVTSIVMLEPLRAILASPPLRSRTWLPLALGMILVVAGLGELVRKEGAHDVYDWRHASYDAARWARTHVPEDAVMAMHDAGVFGYFSGRRVINLDGVVNTMGYQDTLRDGHWSDYLKSRGVHYIVKHDFGDIDYGESVDIRRYDGWSYRVLSHRYDVWSDRIWLSRADEVYRSREYVDGRKRVAATIWRWPDQALEAARAVLPKPRRRSAA